MTTKRLIHVVKPDSILHHVRASHGWSLETLETCWTCLFSLLSLCVGSFRPTSRRRVRDHVSNACLSDILMRSGSRHLVDTCTWLVVAHRHARTTSHSAERLNLCLSGKRVSHVVIHVSTVFVSGHLCISKLFLLFLNTVAPFFVKTNCF